MRDPDITLSAGPTMAYPEVLAAQGKQITYHYDPAFIELFRRTERKVGEAFPHAERCPPHARRGGARARGRRPRARPPWDAGAQPRIRGLRQGDGLPG